MDIMIHKIKSIKLSDLDTVDGIDGPFCVRDIIITDELGNKITVTLFADSGKESALQVAI